MKRPPSGHREVEHTADWELEVWAPDMAGLLEEAACGMYELMGVEVSEELRCHRQVEIAADDREQLLVSFLEELLFIADSEKVAYDGYMLSLQVGSLVARLEGGSILSRSKEIKAVTFHQLKIVEKKRGLKTSIVFDV
jgi:SHS2 domain-containing protein